MLDSLTEQSLRPLRQDLRLVKGAELIDGEPSWIVFDPLRGRYFQIGRKVFQLLSIWRPVLKSNFAELAAERLGRQVSDGEISSVEHFLIQNNLADMTGEGAVKALHAQHMATKRNWFTRIGHNYLFFRIPLVRPDRFLRRAYPWVAPLFSKTAVLITVLIGLLGMFFASRQWEEFSSTFLHFFTLEGAVLFGVTLILVKTIHELAHGFMAVRYGVRVPVMGVAFLLMLPVLYSDVSDAWRLTSRRQKLLIASAGILAELTLAALATFMWVFLPEGGLKSVAFFVATTSWLLSLFINLNPLMRFDGYFILADTLGISNLQPRAFNLGKWLLRELLFGLQAPLPEPVMRRQAIWLAVYGWMVWLYRFVLFLGIALLVYHFTFKVLGIVLFVAEVAWFIVVPIVKELKVWWQMKRSIVKNPRSLSIPVLLLGVAALIFAPLDRQVSLPAVMTAQTQVDLFSPFPARLSQISVSTGQSIQRGELLFSLEAPAREFELAQTSRRADLLQARLDRITVDRDDLSESVVLEQQLAGERQLAKGLEVTLRSLKIVAPFDGRIVDVDKELRQGLWVDETEPLALLVSTGNVQLRGFVEEQDLHRLQPGDTGRFVPDDASQQTLEVSIASVGAVAAKELNELLLASVFGGPIAVEQGRDKELTSLKAIYPIVFTTNSTTSIARMARGKIVVAVEPQSMATSLFRNVLRVLIRESSF